MTNLNTTTTALTFDNLKEKMQIWKKRSLKPIDMEMKAKYMYM